MIVKKRFLGLSLRLTARMRKTSSIHIISGFFINRRSIMLAVRLLWKKAIFVCTSRIQRSFGNWIPKVSGLVSTVPIIQSEKCMQKTAYGIPQ